MLLPVIFHHFVSVSLCGQRSGLHFANTSYPNICEDLFDQTNPPRPNKKQNTFLDPLCLYTIVLFQWTGTTLSERLFSFANVLNTFGLTVPSGWEGWRLHQPPRVQNRSSYRVPAEIVSVASMPLKLIIMHVGSWHTPQKPLMSSTSWLQCLQSLSSQNQELLLCHRLSWRDEQVRLSLHYCLWTTVERLGTSRVL